MGRKKKNRFRYAKMVAARVEYSDFDKFEFIMKVRDKKCLQDLINMFILEYISGSIMLDKDNKFATAEARDDVYEDLRMKLKRGDWM